MIFIINLPVTLKLLIVLLRVKIAYDVVVKFQNKEHTTNREELEPNIVLRGNNDRPPY